MPKSILRARGVARSFGSRVALESIDLDVCPGQVVGLVGPNGSGKTTLLKIIGGFLRPHAGEVRVGGRDPFAEQEEVMRDTRFAFAPPALFEHLTPDEHLKYLTGIGGRRASRVDRRARDEALELTGLAERSSDPVGTFSFGMRQRLVLAQALLPMPKLLVLDEPTDGLDPIGILELRELLLRLRDEHDVGILLSSHLLSELEELVDSLIVLSAGRCVFSGSPDTITKDRGRIRLRASNNARALELLAAADVEGRLVDGEVELAVGAMDAHDAVRILDPAGLTLESFRVHVPGLEAALLERMRAAAGPQLDR